jgi:hypothetical protein
LLPLKSFDPTRVVMDATFALAKVVNAHGRLKAGAHLGKIVKSCEVVRGRSAARHAWKAS